MKKVIIGAALAVMVGAASAQVFNHDVCGEASRYEFAKYAVAVKFNQEHRLGYSIKNGMKCVVEQRGHIHQILWDDGTITIN